MRCCMKLMQGLSVLGERLARLPAGADHPGVNAGLTFAAPRNVGARGSMNLMAERLRDLASEYARFAGPAANPVAAALRELEAP